MLSNQAYSKSRAQSTKEAGLVSYCRKMRLCVFLVRSSRNIPHSDGPYRSGRVFFSYQYAWSHKNVFQSFWRWSPSWIHLPVKCYWKSPSISKNFPCRHQVLTNATLNKAVKDIVTSDDSGAKTQDTLLSGRLSHKLTFPENTRQ